MMMITTIIIITAIQKAEHIENAPNSDSWQHVQTIMIVSGV